MGRFGKGLIHDTRDTRDRSIHTMNLTAGLPAEGATAGLPAHVDLRPIQSPVRDQGDLGACTGFALCGLRESLELRGSTPGALPAPTILSPLWLYYQERDIEGDIGQDGGAQIRTGLRVLQRMGAAPESADPYNPATFADPPPPADKAAAASFKIATYYRIFTLRQLLNTLRYGWTCVLGIDVYESFEADATIRTGLVPLPEPGEQLLGGHAILACGYDAEKETILLKNSWGTDVGDQGYFQLPFAYCEPSAVEHGPMGRVIDAWTAVV